MSKKKISTREQRHQEFLFNYWYHHNNKPLHQLAAQFGISVPTLSKIIERGLAAKWHIPSDSRIFVLKHR